MISLSQAEESAYLESISKECLHVVNTAVVGAVGKSTLLKLLAAIPLPKFNDAEFDAFLLSLVRSGHLRTSGGRFWTPKKAP